MSEERWQSCWNCAGFDIRGTRFVNEAKCHHPKVKEIMDAKGAKYLKADFLHRGCPHFVHHSKELPRAPKKKKEKSNQIAMF